jgi:hypothetical protein
VTSCGLLVACATSRPVVMDTRPVARVTVSYQGDYFSVQHDGAYPGIFDRARGLNVADGRLRGRLCNVDVDYDATWFGSRLHLDGHSDAVGHGARSFSQSEGDVRQTLEMSEVGPGRRRITGGRPPQWHSEVSTSIDLDVSPNRLVGTIGMRTYTLAADGDYLVGTYERHGDVVKPLHEAYALYGRQQLATMVAADEALVLLWMMTCSSTIEYNGKMVRGFSLIALPKPDRMAAPEEPAPTKQRLP